MSRVCQPIKVPYIGEEASQITYDNGYTLVYVPKRGEVFNLSTWVRTGSIHEDDAINGISHFLEHLMFKGTERFGPGEFDRTMEAMGAVINAATWKDFTFYYVTGPQGSGKKGMGGKNFDTALDMHADMMTCSVLPDEEIGPPYDPEDTDYQGEKRERSVVIEEIGMRQDQPWTKVYNALNHMMYPDGHPYQRDVIGTRQIIGHVPRTTLLDYYHRWYSPQNFITVVVGDFLHEILEEKVLKAFKFSDKPQATPLQSGPPLQQNGKRHCVVPGEYQTAFFIMAFHGPASKNLRENIAMDVVSHVLGEGRSSRLVQELVEKPKPPLFNMIATGQSTFKLGNVFFIQGNYSDLETDQALALVHEQISEMLTRKPITGDELSRAVKKLKVDFAETSETASGIAEAIGESMTVVEDIRYYLDYLNVLNSLDVETVNAVARQYLPLDQAYSAVLVPESPQTGSSS